jgi:hypothetical protein
MLPNVTDLKRWGFIMLGVMASAYVITRLAPGVAYFIGLAPRTALLPDATILTPPAFLGMRRAAPASGNGSAPSVRSMLESATV